MALNVPVCGEFRMLNFILNTGSYTNEHPMMRLFVNSWSPADNDQVTSYTELGAIGGYTAKVLSGGSWAVASGNPSQASFAEQTWTFTASVGNIFGYHMVHSQALQLLWSERFTGGPYNIVNSGDQIKVTPVFTLE